MTAGGLCFEYAYHYVKDNGGTLVHAIITEPWPPGKGKRYWHAWVEKGGKIHDWQHEQGITCSNTNVKEHYKIFRPTNIRRYTHKKAFDIMWAKGNRHFGPWGTK
jgi:hypothetical protein